MHKSCLLTIELGIIFSFRNNSPYKGVLNKDVIHILEKNFRLVRKLSTILIQSIFDHLYSMPIGLRILCKIMFKLAEKKVLYYEFLLLIQHSLKKVDQKSILKLLEIIFSEFGLVLISFSLFIMESWKISMKVKI